MSDDRQNLSSLADLLKRIPNRDRMTGSQLVAALAQEEARMVFDEAFANTPPNPEE